MAAKQTMKVIGHHVIAWKIFAIIGFLVQFMTSWTGILQYCEECLVNLSVQSNQQNINITCPECNKTSPVPTGGVKQLPNNSFINRLLDEVVLRRKVDGEEEAKCDHCVREDPVEVLCIDCSTFLCNHCYDYHKFSREYQNHSMMQLNELRSKKEGLPSNQSLTLHCVRNTKNWN